MDPLETQPLDRAGAGRARPHPLARPAALEPAARPARRGGERGLIRRVASVCLVLAWTAQDGAQDRIVVVRSAPELAAEAEALGVATVAALGQRGIRAAIPPPPASEPPDGAAAVGEAERAYHLLRPEEAAGALSALLERHDAGELVLDREELLHALAVLALGRLASGDEEGAAAAVDRALAIDPGYAPDPARYPPTLLERLEARRIEPPGTAQLVVALEPADAELFLDGAATAAGPLPVTPGRHVLRARRDGRVGSTRTVDVGPEGTEITIALAADPGAALRSAGAPGDPIDPGLDLAARALGAAPVIVDVRRDGDGLALEIRDGARRAAVHTAAADGPDRAALALVAALQAGATAGDPTPAIVLGVSAAVVAAAAVVIGVVVSSQGPAGFLVHVETGR